MITAQRLIELEARYGGLIRYEDGTAGGDRMAIHGYAEPYASALNAFVEQHGQPETLVEIGVLRGTGLAMWAEVFPEAEVLGLDRDFARFDDHRDALLCAGADPDRIFTMMFDQSQASPETVGRALGGVAAPAIVIDDASHVDELTLRTLDAFLPHMAEHSLYFVEDQPRVSDIHRKLERNPRGLECRRIHPTLTVLSR